MARQVVALALAESVSRETLRRTLEKTARPAGRWNTGSSRPWPTGSPRPTWRPCLTPTPSPGPAAPGRVHGRADGAVAEGDVVPIPATEDHPRRVDYESERAGTASLFMVCEPPAGWREVRVRERRTKIDWAEETARLPNGRYAGAAKLVLVCDNPNAHAMGAFDEAFDPETARRWWAGSNCATRPTTAVGLTPPVRHDRRVAGGDGDLVATHQRRPARRRLAMPHRQRPGQV